MNYITGIELVAARQLCLTRGAAAQFPALLQQARPCRAMDGAIDASPAQQAGVRRIDDGVDVETRDISNLYANHCLNSANPVMPPDHNPAVRWPYKVSPTAGGWCLLV